MLLVCTLPLASSMPKDSHADKPSWSRAQSTATLRKRIPNPYWYPYMKEDDENAWRRTRILEGEDGVTHMHYRV